jgi:nucleotide-binding universal stress UspA family protein
MILNIEDRVHVLSANISGSILGWYFHMPNILVAVDGSAHSKKVVDFSSDVAKKLSASVTLVYVVKNLPEESPEIVEYERAENFPDAYAEYLRGIGNSVVGKIAKQFEERGVACRPLVEYGNPAERILEVALAGKSEMIIVGLRGLHGAGRLRSLGSVARRIIENAPCPVIVVP